MLFDYQNTVTADKDNNLYYQNINSKYQPTTRFNSQDYADYSNEALYYEQASLSSSSYLSSDLQNQQNLNHKTGNIQSDLFNYKDKQEYETMQTTTQNSSQYTGGYQVTNSSQSLENHLPIYENDLSAQVALPNVQSKLRRLDKRKKQKQLDYISTSTLHNIKTIREYKQQLKKIKKEQQKKQNECEFTTLLIKQVPDREIFFLVGDIIVEPNFRQEWYSVGEPSPYNYYKSLVCNILYKDRKILQSEYSRSEKGLMDFNNVVQVLKNYPDQDTHDYGLILEEYEKRCKELTEIGNIMKNQPDFDIFKEIQDSKYVEFTKRCEQHIDDSRKTKGEFFFYSFCKLDYEKFSYDIQSFGISEAMSQLLGLELTSLSTVIQKKGLISSFSNCTRQMIMKNFIQALSKKYYPCKNEDEESQSDISDTSTLNLTVHTWDGLSINVEGHFHSVYDRTEDFSLIPFTEIMSMVHVKIDERVLETVKKMRYNQQTDTDIMMASGEDLYYNLQSQVFYDKFYASNQTSNEDINPEKREQELEEIKKKTCKYRSLI